MKQLLQELASFATFVAPFVIAALWMEDEIGWAVLTGIIWLMICAGSGWGKSQNDEPKVGPM